MINEPAYGLTAGRGTDKVALAAALEYVRRRICGYSIRLQDVRCDCKYGLSIEKVQSGDEIDYGSEQTGCPELREVIYQLLHGDDIAEQALLPWEHIRAQVHEDFERERQV